MRRCLTVGLALVLGLGLIATRAEAQDDERGTVFIPIITENGRADSPGYLTRILVSNESDELSSVIKSWFLPLNNDNSTTAEEAEPDTFRVGSHTTRVVTVDGDSDSGLLQLEADSDLSFSAEVFDQGHPTALSDRVPIIGERNILAADEVAQLQGWIRTPEGAFTNFAVANFGSESATCAVEVFDSAGGLIGGGAAVIHPRPMSMSVFTDVLDLLQAGDTRDVRASIVCDQPYYALSITFNPEEGGLSFLGPGAKAALAVGDGGSVDDEPSVPGAVVFTRDGVFHAPTNQNNTTAVFNIPLEPNTTFNRVTVELDIYHGGWNSKNPSGNHSLLWLHRGACCWPSWANNNFGYGNAFGPNRNEVRIGSNVGGKHSVPAHVALQPGATYHVEYSYDWITRSIELSLTDKGTGQVIKTPFLDAREPIVTDGSGFFMIYFGHGAHEVGPEVPTYGWEYSNLRVEFIP